MLKHFLTLIISLLLSFLFIYIFFFLVKYHRNYTKDRAKSMLMYERVDVDVALCEGRGVFLPESTVKPLRYTVMVTVGGGCGTLDDKCH